MRFEKYGHILAYKVDTEDPEAMLTYSHLIRFPANYSKFMIKWDEPSGRYYSIATRVYDQNRSARNLLSLMRSSDLAHWETVKDLYDYRDHSVETVGFQYVDFEFEGDDIIYLCRTALNGAHNYHDANYSTFHRIKGFRTL